MSPTLQRFLPLLVCIALLSGCERGLFAPPQHVERSGDGPLQVGVGWSAGPDARTAGRQAAREAADGLDGKPVLVLVWDNFPDGTAGDQLLGGVGDHLPRGRVYGGSVAWPAAEAWTTQPSVLVVALAGGWRITAASEDDILGRQQHAGRQLAERLDLPPARSPAVDERPQPNSAGEVVLLYGDFPGERAGRLLAGLADWAGPRLLLVGGSGPGPAGADRQYVAGNVVANHAWAVRIGGNFHAVGARAHPAAEADAIPATVTSAVLATVRELPERTQPPPWRLTLVVGSSGWLGYLPTADRLAVAAREAAESDADTALAIGWLGGAQIGPRTEDNLLSAGTFDAAVLTLEPIGDAAAVSHPSYTIPATQPAVPAPPPAEAEPPVAPSTTQPDQAALPEPEPEPEPAPAPEPPADDGAAILPPEPIDGALY